MPVIGTAIVRRLEDWPERLLEAIAKHEGLPFEYGVSDCLTFPLACVEAVTGMLPWADEHGPTTERGAAKLLARHGFQGTGDAFAALFPEIPHASAGRGDLGLVRLPETGRMAGVVFLDAGLVGKTVDRVGLLRLPRSLAQRAFRV